MTLAPRFENVMRTPGMSFALLRQLRPIVEFPVGALAV